MRICVCARARAGGPSITVLQLIEVLDQCSTSVRCDDRSDYAAEGCSAACAWHHCEKRVEVIKCAICCAVVAQVPATGSIVVRCKVPDVTFVIFNDNY